MKALILNSGTGRRMGGLTKNMPKCMLKINEGFSIISWQLYLIQKAGIKEAVITTGPFADILKDYVESLKPEMDIRFVLNPDYESTNYIYSIDCARNFLYDDIILMHGDLVFEPAVIYDFIKSVKSCVAIDSALPLPEKDFKAKISGDRVKAIGVEYSGADCVACQPIYRMRKKDMQAWLYEIARFCAVGNRGVYAEDALNNITGKTALYTIELKGRLCSEVDNAEDLNAVSARLKSLPESERISI